MPNKALCHRLDHSFQNASNGALALSEALEEAIRPLRGLTNLLVECARPEPPLTYAISILEACLRDIDYVLEKQRQL